MSSPGDASWGGTPGDAEAVLASGDGEREWPPGAPAKDLSQDPPEDVPGQQTPSTPGEAAKATPRKATPRRAASGTTTARKRSPRKPAGRPVGPPAPVLDPDPVLEPEPVLEPGPEPEPLMAYLADPPEPAVEVVGAPTRRRGRGLVFGGLALLLAVAAGLGAAAWNESKPHTYQSSAALLVDQGALLVFSRDEGLVTKLGALRFKYADEASSTTFAGAVGKRLNLSRATVRGALSAHVAPSSLVLRLTATSTDKALPQVIAQAAAEELVAQVDKEQAAVGITPRVRVTLKIVSPAQQAVHISPSRRRSQELGVGTFAAVLLGAALLRDLTRRRTGPEAAGA